MKFLSRLAILAVGVLIVASPAVARGADILQNVPSDALGIVVVKNLGATDAKVAKLLETLGAAYPSPLAFLEAVTGLRKGLATRGDFMLAVLPPADSAAGGLQYCVWLPVADYEQLLTLLTATSGELISAVRVADEDLIMGRQGEWAVLMDPDQRTRLEQMLKAEPRPPDVLTGWRNWINENDVAVVLLHSGIEKALAWSASPPPSVGRDAEEPEDDLFGQLGDPDEEEPFVAVTEPSANPLYDAVRREVHRRIVRFPKFKDVVSRAEAVGTAARLDDAGSAWASLRLKSSRDQEWRVESNGDASLPPALFRGGEFTVVGAGRLPSELSAMIASVYARQTLAELKTSEHIELDDELAANFEQAFVAAASDISAWSILHQPGDLKTGVHNNGFLVARAGSSKQFIERAADVMEHWNSMHRESDSETKYVFNIEETKLGDRVATQFSLDVGAMGGMPDIPEIRKMMEKFFGPGGKMRLWIAPVDEQMVLLGVATPEQAAAALETLDRRAAIDWNHPELAAANKLLPASMDFRVFFSPRGRHAWKQREMEAMNNGVPVLGAPPAQDFPASPPVVFSGHLQGNELHIQGAVSADTIRGVGMFIK